MEKKMRILFVDDDKALGEMMTTTLEHLGYEAQAESDPHKALRKFASAPKDFDAVILDNAMPGINGLELAEWLSLIRPGLPIILLTGYPETVPEDKTRGARIGSVVFKPITRAELVTALEKVLPPSPAHTLTFVALQKALSIGAYARAEGTQDTDNQ